MGVESKSANLKKAIGCKDDRESHAVDRARVDDEEVAVERVQRRLHRGGLPCSLSGIKFSRGFTLTLKPSEYEYLCKETEKGEASTGVGLPAHCPG